MRCRLFVVTYVTGLLSLIQQLNTTPARCNPALDLLFTLGSVSYLDFAERIIGDLARHPLPEYTIRTGVSVCEDANVSIIPLTSSWTRLLTSLKAFPKDGRRHDPVQNQDQFMTYLNQSCPQSAKDIFLIDNARTTASKMLIFVTNGHDWKSDSYVRAATELKKGNVNVITVGVGIKQINISADLEIMASDKNHFFIIKDFRFLPSLATAFSKGSCQPISVDLSAMKDISPTEVPVSLSNSLQPSGCQNTRLNDTHYQEKRVIPGFGSLSQILACPLGQQYDVTRCGCS